MEYDRQEHLPSFLLLLFDPFPFNSGQTQGQKQGQGETMHLASSNGHFCVVKRTRSEASGHILNCSWLPLYQIHMRCQECLAHRLFLTSHMNLVPSWAKQFVPVRLQRRMSVVKRSIVRSATQNAQKRYEELIAEKYRVYQHSFSNTPLIYSGDGI